MTSICDVTVEFDGHSYVSVQIPDKYRGFTTGICGVCDDKQNDYKTKDGKDVSGSGDRDRLLGNSYKVMRSSEDGCEDKPETSVTCSTELQREVESYDICGIISNGTGPFRKCIQAYPDLVKKYFDICVFDVCANKDSKRLMEMMRCQALEGWAEECAEFSIAWRSDKTCPLNCGENTVYASSGTACPATCMDLRAPSNCLDPPVESCLCKDGFVLSDDQCVPRHKCGCVDSKGKYYEIGEKTVIETCGGLIYECQGQSNDTSKLIPLEERKPCHKNATCGFDEDGIQRCMCLKGFIGDGTENCRQLHTCLGYGDPHYKTFDGQLIDFMGTCKYTMVKASGLDSHCAFHVKVQNEYRGGNTHVSFTKFIDFDIYGTTIRLLKQKKVLVNKERKKVPFQMQNADISIVETGQYIQVDSGCGVSVKFDGDSTVSVHVPDTYMNRTEGICGNFDGYENDYRTKDGKDVSTEKYKFALIGNSYKIDEESQTGCKNGKSAFGVCSSETLKEVESVNSCGIIMDENGPFQECIEEDPIHAKNFFKTCKFDVCSYEDDIVRRTILLCDDIVAFALHCEAIGFSVSWRTSSLCPMACNNATEVFKSDGTGCEASCRDPYAEEKCVFENTEGCFCREGLIRSDTHCVDPSLCGCVDTNGEYYELGDRKTNTNCTHSLECRKVGTKSKLIDVQTNKCHLLANCEFNDEGQRTCICKEGYTGDGNTKCSKCLSKLKLVIPQVLVTFLYGYIRFK
ncbi:hypothetical protein FSP39_016546 [Pinctada imbricata]|uniref:VWFD domain-containing protein n=1 Tax=Pinctada imbricata TaxID=66713 RepID=A0AA89C070_PINIB|nr:hypothetical protein FSP39_016546 [Pinctada imbricata]